MRRILLTTIFLCGLLSCSTNPKEQDKNNALNADTNTIAVDSFESGLPEPQIVSDADKKIVSATDTLYLGDTLKIEFKIPHPKDLGINTPDDDFFFLVYSYNDTAMPSLVDWNQFETTNHLEIITNKTKANPWNARIHESQIIFNKTGKYKILLSDNLETDDGTPVEYHTVYYFNRQRKN